MAKGNTVGQPIPLAVVGRGERREAGRPAPGAEDARFQAIDEDLARIRSDIDSIRKSLVSFGGTTRKYVQRRLVRRVEATVVANPLNAVLAAAGAGFLLTRLYLR